MKLRGGEFSTGTTGIFQPELTLSLLPVLEAASTAQPDLTLMFS